MKDNDYYTVEFRGEDLEKALKVRSLESEKQGRAVSFAETVRIMAREGYERRQKELGGD